MINCTFYANISVANENIRQLHYRRIFYKSRTKCQNLNVPCLVLQLSLPNPLKPGVKPRMNMRLEQRRQAMLQLHLRDEQFYRLLNRVLY